MIGVAINILVIFFVLGLLVTIHELGHFLAAKISKVGVDEFAVGMGPVVFSRKYGATQYSLRAFPIGGYVKIVGEGDDPDVDLEALKNNPHNFQNKHPLVRIFILSAGVFMNLMTAVIIYYGFLFMTDFKTIAIDLPDYQPVFGTIERERHGDVEYELAEKDSNAREAGWPEEGYIVAAGSTESSIVEIVYSDEYRDLVQANKGRDIVTTVCTNPEEEEKCDDYVTAVSDEGYVGISLSQNFTDLIVYTGMSKVFGGFTHSVNVIQMGVLNIASVFSDASETGNYDTAINTVSGPAGLYPIVKILLGYGILGILDLIANLSLTLFIMNLLPIPALDGGRIVLVVAEWILGDLYSKTVEAWAIRISFVALMVFMLAIIIKDIVYWDTISNMFG